MSFFAYLFRNRSNNESVRTLLILLEVQKRKGLRYREEILDNIGSTELSANLFRISQTEEKLIRDNIQTEKEANKTHYTVGKKVRNTIKELGGTMPEDLPTPKKSLKQLEKENKKITKK